jgi:hypothetical protein
MSKVNFVEELTFMAHSFVVPTRKNNGIYRSTFVLPGRQIQVTGDIWAVWNRFGFSEDIPAGLLDGSTMRLPKDEILDGRAVKRALKYLNDDELAQARKNNPNASMYQGTDIHVFTIPTSSVAMRDRDGNPIVFNNGDKPRIRNFMWVVPGHPFMDESVDMSFRQILFANIIERAIGTGTASRSPLQFNEAGELISSADQTQAISKDFDIVVAWEKRLKWRNWATEPDYAKIIESLESTKTWKCPIYIGVRINGPFVVYLYQRCMIKSSKNGLWIDEPHVDRALMRLRTMSTEHPELKVAEFIDLERGRLAKDVKYESLPEELRKLVNPASGWIWSDNRPYVEFRANAEVAPAGTPLNPDGTAIGSVVNANWQVKNQALQLIAEDLKKNANYTLKGVRNGENRDPLHDEKHDYDPTHGVEAEQAAGE